MKEYATIELVKELIDRINCGNCQLVGTSELNALMTTVEVELLNRYAVEQNAYPELSYD